ncbi:hypothetical protein L6452_08757 [Arctium lappa]|uniref:Uncharacterized protein n=1 Tax=Arctium lappa TaxID=4217 RepID=A0ACB9DI69_ARCLA|nr:hypothetical protein L6452_08757 [Arctium lappa]
MSVDDTGSNVAGLTFMAFQADLSHYSQMKKVRRLVSVALKREKVALGREQAALVREKAALAKKKTVADHAESLSVRLDDALNVLEVAGHDRVEL